MSASDKRQSRAGCARDTLACLERGFYETADGRRADLQPALRAAIAGTRAHDLASAQACAFAAGSVDARITTTRQTTLAALAELAAGAGGRVGCLNFASARNPGGGFLGGSQAQEESLARSSGLYPCLLTQEPTYEENRRERSTLYLDRVIHSPGVPFFRNDDGRLLDAPYLADVVTCAAPNAGAIHANEPHQAPQILPTLTRRADLVLRVASAAGVRRLVLGAWGCGVFRNDPAVVAGVFARQLAPGTPARRAFDAIVFAVYDPSPDAPTYAAFMRALSE